MRRQRSCCELCGRAIPSPVEDSRCEDCGALICEDCDLWLPPDGHTPIDHMTDPDPYLGEGEQR